MTPRSPADFRDFKQVFTAVMTEENASNVRAAVEALANQHLGRESTRYMPTDQQVRNAVREWRTALGTTPRETSEGVEPSVPGDYVPLETSTTSDSSEAATNQGKTELSWARLPANEGARQVVKAMARETFPMATAMQDSLNIFCQSSEAQKTASGEAMHAGSALALPKEQKQMLLATLATKMQSPEATRALALVQVLLPAFLGDAGAPSLRAALASWTQKNVGETLSLPKFLDALQSLGQMTGLSSMGGGQELLGALAKELGNTLLAGGDVSEAGLKEIGQRLMALAQPHSPLVGGLSEFFGAQLQQGLGTMLQPLMKLLSGLFLMKTENQWPKMLPNDKVLAELATLFSAQSQRSDKKKRRPARKRKGILSVLGLSGTPHQVVAEDDELADKDKEDSEALAS